MLTGKVPCVAPGWTLMLMLLEPEPFTELGPKFKITPDGTPLELKLTVPVNPNSDVTVAVALPFPPRGRVRLVGETAIENSGLPTTFRGTEMLWLMVPFVPVTVTVVAPTAADAVAVNVSVLTPFPPATDVGLKVAVTPEGKGPTVNATLPLKLFTGLTVIVLVPVPACITLALVAAKLKSGLVEVGIAGKAFTIRSWNCLTKNDPAGGESG